MREIKSESIKILAISKNLKVNFLNFKNNFQFILLLYKIN